eukprot:CAMPEP_0197035678 /NCGR_PEP_ID=MMETSP1384-20130603/13410_1 /TAXON_ID=29189 /ORGANISM="Ammonia sp." /LENGTH=217 /DNA_ID=CAMNT_0042465769 /DNA_START=23 /DNA_END=676 /DNA_ORIENTATION=+
MAQPLRRSQRIQQKRQRASVQANDGLTKQKDGSVQKSKSAKKAPSETIGKTNTKTNAIKRDTKKYWLMKSEPDAFSIDDLMAKAPASEHWDGIRNYQVRNMIRDEIKCGDEALFYHSNCKPPGIVGTMLVTKHAYPDFTAFDKKEKYYDPKSDQENPRWLMFDVQFQTKFKRMLSLPELKEAKGLQNMRVLQKGNRLSITPVTKQEYELICQLAKSS